MQAPNANSDARNAEWGRYHFSGCIAYTSYTLVDQCIYLPPWTTDSCTMLASAVCSFRNEVAMEFGDQLDEIFCADEESTREFKVASPSSLAHLQLHLWRLAMREGNASHIAASHDFWVQLRRILVNKNEVVNQCCTIT